ncbi:tail fiber domain-containing protein [Patescibacteria group bacterium]|nr:tail fiber domain-containing protein [Patescibacteria group bacterium]
MKPNRGFTIIELVVYVSILAIVGGLLTSILYNSVRITSREGASTEVAQQLNLVMGTIQKLVGDASLVESAYETPGDNLDPTDDTLAERQTACTDFCTLMLRFEASSTDPTWLIASSTGIWLVQGNATSTEFDPHPNATSTTTQLTTSKVVVDYLRFTRYEFAGGHTSAKVDMSFTYNTDNDKFRITRSLTSAIGRVTAATFDDNVLPNITGTIDSGLSLGSPSEQWRSAYFSDEVHIGDCLSINTLNTGENMVNENCVDRNLRVSGEGYVMFNTQDTASTTVSSVLTLRHSIDGAGANGIGTGITFQADDTGGGYQPIAHIYAVTEDATTGAVDSSLQFYTYKDDTSGVRMTIDSDGYVGIGATDPTQPLVVNNTSDKTVAQFIGVDSNTGFTNDAGQLEIINTDTTNNNWSRISFGDSISDTSSGAIGLKYTDHTNNYGNMYFYLRSSSSFSSRLTILQNGNIGIGTDAPAAALHINATTDEEGLRIYTGLNENQILAYASGTLVHNIWSDGSGDGLIDISDSSGTTNVRLYSAGQSWLNGGDFGLGKSSASYQLDLEDNNTGPAQFVYNTNAAGDGIWIKVEAATPATNVYWMVFRDSADTTDGSIRADGSGGVAFNTTSDQRLKKNISPFNGSLDIISKINPYNFVRMDDTAEQNNVGFLAQELYKYYPYAVTGEPTDDPTINPMQVDYGKLTPLLVGAIKEQQAQIDLLQEKYNQLTGENINISEEVKEDSNQERVRAILGAGLLGGLLGGALILLLLERKH